MLLFGGAIEAVATIGAPGWFVGTGIDHAWAYVARTRPLIDQRPASPHWESVAIERIDRW